jgi:hypothetical protein
MGFAFIQVLSNIKSAVAASVLCDVWVSVVAWTDYVSVKVEVSGGESAWTRGVAIPFFILF